MKSNATLISTYQAITILKLNSKIKVQKKLHHLSVNLIGHTTENLIVLGYKGKERWWVHCKCGKITIVKTTRIRDGQKSCGCIANAEIHGGSYSESYPHFRRLLKRKTSPPIIKSWLGPKGFIHFIKDVGEIPKSGCILVTSTGATQCDKTSVRWVYDKSKFYLSEKSSFISYRAVKDRAKSDYLKHIKGESISKRWLDGEGLQNGFACFLEDLGPRPSKVHTVDRKNNFKGYTPENCRWATPRQQRRNQRSRVNWITYKGKRKTLSDWSKITGISWGVLKKRWIDGLPINLVMKPFGHTKQKQAVKRYRK